MQYNDGYKVEPESQHEIEWRSEFEGGVSCCV